MYCIVLYCIMIWVDGLVIAASSRKEMDTIKQLLSSRFKMVDLGELTWFLGIEFKRNEECIEMKQTTYLKNVLKKFNMENCKPVSTSCEDIIDDANCEPISITLLSVA